MRQNVVPLCVALSAMAGSSALSQSAPVAPLSPLTSTATTAPVQGFGSFQFGDTLQKVKARLEGRFLGQTYVFDRGFGRVSLRLHRGLQLNSQDAQALSTFVDGKLADVLLELDPRSTDKQNLLSSLRQRFGVTGKTAPSAMELQFGRPALTTFAGRSVVVEDSSALSSSAGPATRRWHCRARFRCSWRSISRRLHGHTHMWSGREHRRAPRHSIWAGHPDHVPSLTTFPNAVSVHSVCHGREDALLNLRNREFDSQRHRFPSSTCAGCWHAAVPVDRSGASITCGGRCQFDA